MRFEMGKGNRAQPWTTLFDEETSYGNGKNPWRNHTEYGAYNEDKESEKISIHRRNRLKKFCISTMEITKGYSW